MIQRNRQTDKQTDRHSQTDTQTDRHKQTDRHSQTDKQTDRHSQTDKQTDRQTSRQTDTVRQTERHGTQLTVQPTVDSKLVGLSTPSHFSFWTSCSFCHSHTVSDNAYLQHEI